MFFAKGQMANILGSSSHVVSVTATQLCGVVPKQPETVCKQMGWVPIKLYLQTGSWLGLARGPGRPTSKLNIARVLSTSRTLRLRYSGGFNYFDLKLFESFLV